MSRQSYGYTEVKAWGHPRARNGYVLEHILKAEKALGKPIPKKHPIHHFDKTQLVICENAKYHHLLHIRTKALRACGHANWRKCTFCKQYDSPDKLFIPKSISSGVCHRECRYEYKRKYSV